LRIERFSNSGLLNQTPRTALFTANAPKKSLTKHTLSYTALQSFFNPRLVARTGLQTAGTEMARMMGVELFLARFFEIDKAACRRLG
jgi:hypothetical protein